ncbi:HET-domain-containing protein [Apiospora arundinis]
MADGVDHDILAVWPVGAWLQAFARLVLRKLAVLAESGELPPRRLERRGAVHEDPLDLAVLHSRLVLVEVDGGLDHVVKL